MQRFRGTPPTLAATCAPRQSGLKSPRYQYRLPQRRQSQLIRLSAHWRTFGRLEHPWSICRGATQLAALQQLRHTRIHLAELGPRRTIFTSGSLDICNYSPLLYSSPRFRQLPDAVPTVSRCSQTRRIPRMPRRGTSTTEDFLDNLFPSRIP